jgi:hypothetical protein
VYVDPDPVKVYTLPTEVVVPDGTTLTNTDLLQQLEKARELAKRPTIIHQKVDQTPDETFDKLMASPKYQAMQVEKKKADEKEKAEKEKADELKMRAISKEETLKILNDKEALLKTEIGKLLDGKADKSALEELNKTLAKLGEIEEAKKLLDQIPVIKANAEKVPGLEDRVSKLETPPPTPVPAVSAKAKEWFTRCYTGSPDAILLYEGKKFILKGLVAGTTNNYLFVEE